MTLKARKQELFLSLSSYLWLILFFLIPTLIVISYGFKPPDLYGGVGEGWTFHTYSEIFKPYFGILFLRTFIISSITTLVSVVLSLPVAITIARAKPKIRRLMLFLVIIPFWSSFIVRIFAWKSILHPEGFIKNFLVFLNILSQDTILLYNPIAVIIVMVYSFLPFSILPIFAAAEKFDYQLIEAAMDLGLTKFKAFIKIFLPGIRRGILTGLFMVFIPAVGAYVIPDVIGGPESEMVGNKIMQRAFLTRNIPQASALSTLLGVSVILPMAAIAYLQLRKGAEQLDFRNKQ